MADWTVKSRSFAQEQKEGKSHVKHKKDKHGERPCGDDIPDTPGGLSIGIDKEEGTRDDLYRLILSWTGITTKLNGKRFTPDGYVVQIQHGQQSDYSDADPVRQIYLRGRDDGDRTAGTTEPNPNSGTPPTTAIFHGVKKGDHYRGRVKASNEKGCDSKWGDWQNIGELGVADTPNAPEAVLAYAGTDKVNLKWKVVVDGTNTSSWASTVTHFQVQCSTNAGYTHLFKDDKYVTGDTVSYMTRHYRKKYYFRIRAGNNVDQYSAWVAATHNGISPRKPKSAGTKGSETRPSSIQEVDRRTGSGYATAGGTKAGAYLTANASAGSCYIDVADYVEGGDYSFRGELTTSGTAARTHAGFLFRGTSASQYLFVEMTELGVGVRDVKLYKRKAGTNTLLETATGITPTKATAYDFDIVCVGNGIQILVDGVEKITHTLTSTDITDFGAQTIVGLWENMGAGDDDGGSRFREIVVSTIANGVDVIWDSFDRHKSTTTPGSTEGLAALAWTEASGAWGISDEGVDEALYGISVSAPRFFGADDGVYTASCPVISGGSTLNYSLITIDIDRPVKIMIHALADIKQSSNANINVKMFVGVALGTGSPTHDIGMGSSCYYANNGNVDQQAVSREITLDPGAGNTGKVEFFLEYQQSGAAAKNITVARQKMTIDLSYAPEFVATTRTAAWAPTARTATAYFVQEPGDTM